MKFSFVEQSGHVRLARQLTLLMALCIYVGNSVKVPTLGELSICLLEGSDVSLHNCEIST